MIQIQHPGQFEKAAARLESERMGVRRSGAHLYEVTNKAKGNTYHVRFTRTDLGLFASCDCPAGTRHGQAPQTCEHLVADVLFVRAIGQGWRQGTDDRREREIEATKREAHAPGSQLYKLAIAAGFAAPGALRVARRCREIYEAAGGEAAHFFI